MRCKPATRWVAATSRWKCVTILLGDRIQAVSIPAQHFMRFQVENRTALGGPRAPVPIEHSGSRAKIADRFDVFHAAAFDRFKADTHRHKADEFTGRTVAG